MQKKVFPQPGSYGLANSLNLDEIQKMTNPFVDVTSPNHPSNMPGMIPGYDKNQNIHPPSDIPELGQQSNGLAGTGYTDENQSKIRGFEGNDYSAYADIGDGAGKSIGAYQFTEKSGMAQQLANRLGFKSINDPGFQKAIGTDAGVKVQDELYQTYTRRPQELAQKYGVKDNNVLGFLIDTNLNGGLGDVAEGAIRRGGLTMDNLKAARLERYNMLAKQNPEKYGQFIKGWTNRVNSW